MRKKIRTFYDVKTEWRAVDEKKMVVVGWSHLTCCCSSRKSSIDNSSSRYESSTPSSHWEVKERSNIPLFYHWVAVRALI
jgi:hypothetical protein